MSTPAKNVSDLVQEGLLKQLETKLKEYLQEQISLDPALTRAQLTKLATNKMAEDSGLTPAKREELVAEVINGLDAVENRLQEELSLNPALTREQLTKFATDKVGQHYSSLTPAKRAELVAKIINGLDTEILIIAQLLTNEKVSVTCKQFDTIALLKAKIHEAYTAALMKKKSDYKEAGLKNIRAFLADDPNSQITLISKGKKKNDNDTIFFSKINSGDFLLCKKDNKPAPVVEPQPSTPHTPVANSSGSQPVVEVKAPPAIDKDAKHVSGSAADDITLSIKVYDDVTQKEHNFKFSCKHTDSVPSIRQHIAKETGYAVESLRLHADGFMLDEDNRTLASYNIKTKEYNISVYNRQKAPAAQPAKDDVKSPAPAAQPPEPFKLAQQIDAFHRIYKALRDGQSGIFKTDRWTENMSAHDAHVKVTAYAEKNKNSRTALAWNLAQKHSEDASATNDALVKAIYKQSFAESGFFKCSKVLGKAFYSSSKEFNDAIDALEPGKFTEHSQNDKNSRTHKICEALSPSPKMS